MKISARRPGAGPFRLRPLHAGIAAALVAALLVWLLPQNLLALPRERFFDALTQALPQTVTAEIVAVDIDRAAFQSAPGGDWTRTQTAALIARIAAAKPAVIAFDLVFSGDCGSTAGITALAEALSAGPSVLGFLIGSSNDAPRPRPPLAVSRSMTVPESWFIDGTEVSCPLLQDAARSAAATFLIGDADSKVRQVAAFAIVGTDAYPTLALEAVRVAGGVRTPILGGDPPWLRWGERVIPLGRDGGLRFVAGQPATIAARTVSAAAVIAGNVPSSRLAGKIVLVGSSLPNLGGLRASASMPLEPSLQIHADLATALVSGFIPRRDTNMVVYEALATLVLGVGLVLAATRLRPVLAAAAGIVVILTTLAATLAMFATTALLVDGLTMTLALLVVLSITSILQFAQVRRSETRARQRFSQYLPESVVARYLDNPDMGRVAGEERQVTALFTDIEGFATLANRVSARDLVEMLDIYYSEVTRLVADCGGMVDKIVGDAVHALFNAPEDLDAHVDRAIDCSQKMRALTEEIRQRPLFRDNGFAAPASASRPGWWFSAKSAMAASSTTPPMARRSTWRRGCRRPTSFSARRSASARRRRGKRPRCWSTSVSTKSAASG